MSGIGGQEQSGKVVTYQTPLPDTVDGVVDSLREIILKGSVVGISVKHGEPIVYERFLPAGQEVPEEESTASFAELKPLEVLRNVDMEEFDPASYLEMPDPPGPTLVMWMIVYLEMAGLTATHIFTSSNGRLWPWLHVARGPQKLERFLGMRVMYEDGLPDDIFLLCGSPHRGATFSEIKYALKANVPVRSESNEESEEDS